MKTFLIGDANQLENTKVVVKYPMSFLPDELNQFYKLMEASGEVSLDGLKTRIKNAFLLAFLYVDDKLEGICALKYPNESYKFSVFTKSDSEENPEDFEYELGWLYVNSTQRGQGLAYKICKEIISYADSPVFLTVRQDNKAMINIAKKLGFSQSGQPYRSSRGNYFLLLFTVS